MRVAKYGAAFSFEVPMIKAGSTDFAATGDWTPAAGDVKVSKDGGAVANITTLPTAVTGTGSVLWTFALSATEMEAARITIQVVDSATKAVEDTAFDVFSYGNASAQHAFDLDAAELQTEWANGGRLDNLLDATALEASITALNDVSAAQVNAEVSDVLKTDTVAEMAQGAPPLAPTAIQILNYLYRELVRNKVVVDTNTANQKQVFADNGSTILYEKDLTNATNVTTVAEATTGA